MKLEMTNKEYKKLLKESPMTIFQAHEITIVNKKGERKVMKNRLFDKLEADKNVVMRGHMRRLRDGTWVFVNPKSRAEGVRRDIIGTIDKIKVVESEGEEAK